MLDKSLKNIIEKNTIFLLYKIDGELESRTVHIYHWTKQHGCVGNTTSEAGAR